MFKKSNYKNSCIMVKFTRILCLYIWSPYLLISIERFFLKKLGVAINLIDFWKFLHPSVFAFKNVSEMVCEIGFFIDFFFTTVSPHWLISSVLLIWTVITYIIKFALLYFTKNQKNSIIKHYECFTKTWLNIWLIWIALKTCVPFI